MEFSQTVPSPSPGHGERHSVESRSDRRSWGGRFSPSSPWANSYALSIARFDSAARGAIEGIVGRLPSKVRPRHAQRLVRGLAAERKVVCMWRTMLICMAVGFTLLVAATLGMIYALVYAQKNVEIHGAVMVPKGGGEAVQVLNPQLTINERGFLVASNSSDITGKKSETALKTINAFTLKPLSSNMTTSELRNVRKVYLKALGGVELALRVRGFYLRVEPSTTGGDGMRVVLMDTTSGTLELRGETVSLAKGARGLLLGPDGSLLTGLQGAVGLLSQ